MGMVNYLSTSVPHLATVAAPLTRLCGDIVKFKWEPIHDACLQQVKDIISAEAILKPINYESTDPIFLITDASVKGIGAWVGQGPSIQDIQPAAFYSRKFKRAELNYSVTEKETLAIIDGLRHFQPQLNRTKFMILTDHAACLAFPKTTDGTDRNAQWLIFLSGFDYTIQHLQGKKNVLADTLSRYFKKPCSTPTDYPKTRSEQTTATTTSNHNIQTTNNYLSTHYTFIFPDITMPSYAQIASAQVSIPRTEEGQAATVLTTMKESVGTPPWTQKEKEDYQNEWDDFSKLLTAHMNCEYNACRSRGISAGHSPDCPFLEEYNKSIKAKEVSTNEKTSDEVEPLTNELMDIDIKGENNYDTTEAGCVKHHLKHALLHWTGCYIDDCKIHTHKLYEPKPPSWAQVCTYCGQYGHKVINCDANNKMIKVQKAKIESLAIHVRPPLVCSYCKRNGHLKEKCYKKLMEEYRMLNNIHKPSSTRAEVSTSSSERDHEETAKSRFSEKEIRDQTRRPKLPVPDNLHKDYTKTIEPEQRWTLIHEGPLTTETEQSDEWELSDISSAAFKAYKHVWDYCDNTRLSESPPSASTTPESPATRPQTPPEEKAITGSPQAWGPIEAPITKERLLHIQHMYRGCPDFKLVAQYPELHNTISNPELTVYKT